jgi:hypothetical protein
MGYDRKLTVRPEAGPPFVGSPRTVRLCDAPIIPLPLGWPPMKPTSTSVLEAYLATSAIDVAPMSLRNSDVKTEIEAGVSDSFVFKREPDAASKPM